MFCNGLCGICPNQCYKGEFTPKEMKGINKAFNSVKTSPNVETLQKEEVDPNETGLAVVENVGTYEVTTNIFGKQKVRKVK